MNRLCKVLDRRRLKLTTWSPMLWGASVRRCLPALVEGTTDPTVLADLARGVLRKKLPELRRALHGRFRRHHAFLIEQIFAKIDFLDETLDRLTTEIDGRLGPFEPMLAALDTIPGVDRIGAVSILAETGGDMRRFPSAGHLCSWRDVARTERERWQTTQRKSARGMVICSDQLIGRQLRCDTQERSALHPVSRVSDIGGTKSRHPRSRLASKDILEIDITSCATVSRTTKWGRLL